MVTECSPLNQLQSIKIDLKIHTRGPKTDNYSPNVGRSVTLFDLCVLFLMALDNEWLIITSKVKKLQGQFKYSIQSQMAVEVGT